MRYRPRARNRAARAAALERDLSEILDAKVDVVPASDLKPGVAGEVLAEAVPL